MILRSSPRSPFVRQVRIAEAILNLTDQITLVPAEGRNPSDNLREQNPLGKMPVLIADNGAAIYDSRVIIEYLNEMAGGQLYPIGAQRFDALTWQALANGMIDAMVEIVQESIWRQSDRRESSWIDHHAGKIQRGLAATEANYLPFRHTVNVGDVALACALASSSPRSLALLKR